MCVINSATFTPTYTKLWQFVFFLNYTTLRVNLRSMYFLVSKLYGGVSKENITPFKFGLTFLIGGYKSILKLGISSLPILHRFWLDTTKTGWLIWLVRTFSFLLTYHLTWQKMAPHIRKRSSWSTRGLDYFPGWILDSITMDFSSP